MGESAVLFQHSYSFAAPPSRHESHEDNPIHALSQSVSFGRFVTENLEWGRWSSFSHKKYVDEAEKFSQPGSVAQKKAFFEAHYKRIAEAKKAKAADESFESDPKQEPESVVVLLSTLETLTKDEVKENERDATELVMIREEELVLSIEKDDEPERKSVAVLEQEDAEMDTSLVKPVVADDLQEKEKENHSEDAELLEKSYLVGEKEEERRSVTKNSSVFRFSMETSATSETTDKAMEVVLSQEISEKPITRRSPKKNEKPVSPRFGFLSCLMGTKTEDQNPTKKKRKTGKKPSKPFLWLCFKPEMVGETEAARRR
ncbi:PREDICTED: protein WVD2-like 7 [Camelina sativa]|uniref:Protein WVD2-like 7 n=1 Tax=Camelina sativa TaxID=90675 RepID=A0ABM0V4H4_CAMSA|nr:PREDICTED: protein WVD2-like 7 [Camelina sativa]